MKSVSNTGILNGRLQVLYSLLPHWVPATWRTQAQTNMRAELSSGKLTTMRVRRRILRFSRTSILEEDIFRASSCGKSQKANEPSSPFSRQWIAFGKRCSHAWISSSDRSYAYYLEEASQWPSVAGQMIFSRDIGENVSHKMHFTTRQLVPESLSRSPLLSSIGVGNDWSE